MQSVTFEMIFPFLLLETEKEKLETLLSEEAELLFGSESELRKTIKLFIENNSNVTLTAKSCICIATACNIGLINLLSGQG